MDITKDMQVKVLEYLKNLDGYAFPESFVEDMVSIAGSEYDAYQLLKYLSAHELIEGRVVWKGCLLYQRLSITHLGLDSLMDDGGRTAENQHRFITLDANSVELICALIRQSSLGQQEQNSLVQKVQRLSGETLKRAMGKTVDVVVQHLVEEFLSK